MQPKDLKETLSNTFAEAEEQAPPAAARAIALLRRILEPILTTILPVRPGSLSWAVLAPAVIS